MMNMKPTALALSLSSIFLLQSHASYAVQPGVYLGVGAGGAHDEILNETESAYKVFGGLNLTPNLGLEVAYVDLGSYLNETLDQDGVSIEAVGYLPIASNVDLFGKFGIYDWEVRDRFLSATATGTDTSYGMGLNVALSYHSSFRAEWQNFMDVAGGDVSLLSASLSLHF